MDLLCNTLEDPLGFANIEDAYVAGNMAIYYSALQAKKNDFKAPDVFVVLGSRRSWTSWPHFAVADARGYRVTR